jgi:hypothetical protein
MEALTDYGLFKNSVPSLKAEDARSYSSVTVEFWAKFGKV